MRLRKRKVRASEEVTSINICMEYLGKIYGSNLNIDDVKECSMILRKLGKGEIDSNRALRDLSELMGVGQAEKAIKKFLDKL